MSKVFDETYSPDIPEPLNAREIIKGGTGYGLDNRLPDEIEHIYTDYSLYPEHTGISSYPPSWVDMEKSNTTAYGFLTRGCPRGCQFCIVAQKEGRRSYKAADLSEWWSGQKNIKLLDPNLLACPDYMELLGQLADSGAWVDFTQGLDARLLTEGNVAALNQIKTKMIHFAWDDMEQSETVLLGLKLYAKAGAVQDHRKRRVYVLTNFGTSEAEDLYRVYTLRDMGFDPYVMIFDKPNAPRRTRLLQRWCNNKRIFRAQPDFSKYDPKEVENMNQGLTDRQLYELIRACGMRVCSSEEHHGCPYWKVNPFKCADIMYADFEAMIERLLALGETARGIGDGMTTEREASILERAVETYGTNAQIDMMIEEMSELTKALCKFRCAHDGAEHMAAAENVLEEMADVGIMLNQMALIFGDPVEQEIAKLERLEKRLEEAKHG